VGPIGIAVCNRKGGVGKTTIATNLAVKLISSGASVGLADCDPQQSAQSWMTEREKAGRGFACAQSNSGYGRAPSVLGLRLPPTLNYIIYDAPACGQAHDLVSILRRAQLAIIPILPSPIDWQASVGFLDELTRLPEVRSGRLKLAFVANRTRANNNSTRRLRTKLAARGLPLIGELRDSQMYVYAAGLGLAAHELKASRAAAERFAWNEITDKLNTLLPNPIQPRVVA